MRETAVLQVLFTRARFAFHGVFDIHKKSGLGEPVISEASDSSPTVSSRRWKDKVQRPALGLPLRIGILD